MRLGPSRHSIPSPTPPPPLPPVRAGPAAAAPTAAGLQGPFLVVRRTAPPAPPSESSAGDRPSQGGAFEKIGSWMRSASSRVRSATSGGGNPPSTPRASGGGAHPRPHVTVLHDEHPGLVIASDNPLFAGHAPTPTSPGPTPHGAPSFANKRSFRAPSSMTRSQSVRKAVQGLVHGEMPMAGGAAEAAEAAHEVGAAPAARLSGVWAHGGLGFCGCVGLRGHAHAVSFHSNLCLHARPP